MEHCCFSEGGLHAAACMQPAFPKSPSRTHLCREDELTDDVCCVLTPIGEPHHLRHSLAANPIICGERGKDSIKSRKHPLINNSFLPAPPLLAAFSHHRTIPGATASLHLQPLFPGLKEDKTQPTLQREQHSKENTFKCQKAMKETDIILRGKKQL